MTNCIVHKVGNLTILESRSHRVDTSDLKTHLDTVAEHVHDYDGLIVIGRADKARLGTDELNESRLALGRKLQDRNIPFAVIPCTTSQFVLGRGIQAISKATGGFFDTVEEALDYFENWHHLHTSEMIQPVIQSPDSSRDAAGNWETIQAEYSLTDKELEVVQYLFRTGSMNAEIADFMGIRESTVKQHLHQVLAKANARDRVDLIIQIRDFLDN